MKKRIFGSELSADKGGILEHIKKLYSVKGKNEPFQAWFSRVMAICYTDKQKNTINYLKKALVVLEIFKGEVDEGIETLETLYLLGEYNRKLGNIQKAKEYFDKVENYNWNGEEENKEAVLTYFKKISIRREQQLESESVF